MELVTNTQSLWEFISQPWHWAVSGAAIAFVLFLMTYLGRSFGISTTFRNFCTLAGAGKNNPFFDVDMKEESWRMVFVLGAIIGAVIATTFLRSPEPVAISASTVDALETLGIDYPESDSKDLGFMPTEVFNFGSLKGILLAIAGGFLVGFGARYGAGCTSGHGITGLSHLQLPSLLTVIGFFIGGLLMTHFLFPILMTL